MEFRQQLTEIDDKVENVVSNLGDMVRKSELSPIMLNLGKPEIPPGWLVLNGQPVENDLAYQQIYTLANKTITIIIAEASGKAYQNVDKIYMYGGDSSKLTKDIMTNVTQVSESLGETLGIDLKSLLGKIIDAKLDGKKKDAEQK